MWIKNFYKFKELNESLSIWYDSLLNSINAQEVDIEKTLKLKGKTDLEYLNNNNEFINTLASSNMKKSDMEESKNYETFLSTPCKFMFIYDIKSSELDTPYYLLLQIFNSSLNKYEDTKCFKVNADITYFYNQLSSKVIEVIDGKDKYVYDTSNNNEWTLKSNNSNDTYKKLLKKQELETIIKSRNAKIKTVQNNNI